MGIEPLHVQPCDAAEGQNPKNSSNSRILPYALIILAGISLARTGQQLRLNGD